MALTPQQTTSVTAALSVDLSLQTVDRLIELCLLHKAAPDTYPQFVDLLKIEIDRRFTSVEIAADDVMFSVLNNFYNGFKSNIPYYARKMQEMSVSVNRDIWFTDNATLMTSFADDIEAMEWLVLPEQETILTRILNNALGIMFLGNSVVSATAILTNPAATGIWKNSPFTRIHWPLCKNGMDVVHKSEELINYYIDEITSEIRQFLINIYNSTAAMESLISTNFAIEKYCLRGDVVYPLQANYSVAMTVLASSSVAMDKIAVSSVAMTPIAVSSVAMTPIAVSSVAMTPIAVSSVAMNKIAVSSVAMNRIAKSSTALSAIVKSTYARNAVMGSNTIFQNNRAAIYNTVKASWTKQAGISDYTGPEQYMTKITNAVASPTGFVFASLGWSHVNSRTDGKSNMMHPNGTSAAENRTSNRPETLASLDGVSFNGAKIKATIYTGGAYAELWIPPA